MSDIFTYLFLALTVISIVGLVIYSKMQDKKALIKNGGKNNTKKESTEEDEKLEKSKIQEALEIEEIENTIIKLTKNGSIRTVMSISSPDFELATDEEQTMFENALMRFGLVLNFPVQFFTTTTKIETKEAVKNVSRVIYSEDEHISQELRNYASSLHDTLVQIGNTRGVYVRKSFCIVGVDHILDEKRAILELKNRIETVKSSLQKAKMKINILDREKNIQLFAGILNRGDNISIEKMLEEDSFAMFSKGVGTYSELNKVQKN